jgi:hypothetical protein
MLYFGSLGDPDYLAACGQPHCCILATGATCADALGCPPDDDFDYDTVDEIASDLAVMEPESVVRLLRENPEHVEYFAMRRAVVVKGCGGALKAVLPLMEKQVAALEAADL